MSHFDSKNRTFRHRNEIDVLLRLKDSDEAIPVTIFTGAGERALDLLNDTRAFIPVRLPSGEITLTAKTQIASIAERKFQKDQERAAEKHEEDFRHEEIEGAAAKKSFDPYAMLRVAPSASADEIRAAYKARIKMVHPDALASLGLDEDITKAAILATQKVNYAYQKIMRERGSTTERFA